MQFNDELKQSIASFFKARFPYLYIPTWEESRACELINEVAKDESMIRTVRKVYVWTQTDGFYEYESEAKKKDTNTPLKALEFVESNEENAIYIFKDLHNFFGAHSRQPDYSVIRKMRDLIRHLKGNPNVKENVVLISPELIIPDDMQKEITVFDLPLPNEQEIQSKLNQMIQDNGLTNPSDEIKSKIAKSALGLTLQEAENAFSRAIIKGKGVLDNNAISVIFDEKNQVIKKTGILEFIKSDINIDDIGGLDNLKNWLKKRNNSWSNEAKRYNIPAPKGVLITGVPGCGKSLTAKAMSAIWQLPLLKLDMGKIFSGLVGSSEENMRRAIATAEAVAPSILMVDEIEKGLAGTGSSGDGGTSTRIFGTFLTWMQEKTAPVFVIATANDISSLPPELMRKGRFDEIFFVDIPTFQERKKIFEVHINKRIKGSDVAKNLNIDDAFLSKLSEESDGFIGSEIEQVIISALYEAFFNKRDIIEGDFYKAIKGTVRLSVTQKEQIMRLREWANVRAVSATSRNDREVQTSDSEDDNAESSIRGGRLLDY